MFPRTLTIRWRSSFTERTQGLISLDDVYLKKQIENIAFQISKRSMYKTRIL